MLGDGRQAGDGGVSTARRRRARQGRFSPWSGPRAHHPTRPVRLVFRLFLGAAASQRGPASCHLPGLALGRLQLLPPFLVWVPGEAAGVRWPVLLLRGPWGEPLPSLSARPGGGRPRPRLPLDPLLLGFQEPLTFHFPWWKPGRWSQAARFTASPRGPWRRLLEDRVRPSPCPLEVQPLAGDTLRWEPGTRQRARLHPGGARRHLAQGGGCGRGRPTARV